MRAISSVTAVAACFVLGAFGATGALRAQARPGWNPRAAAHYLDSREGWWQSWYETRLDHGTVCISCHTVLPYAFGRPALRAMTGQKQLTSAEKVMLGSIEKRVQGWSEMHPYYSEAAGPGKSVQSRATESVLNAVLLAAYDSREKQVRPVTRAAFRHAWALQDPAGGWNWQDFKLAPWETADSGYFGATLLLRAANSLPQHFATERENRGHVRRVEDYLRRGYSAQPLINRLYVLWAAANSPLLLSTAERRALRDEIGSLQQADGGWRNAGVDHTPRKDHSAAPAGSDGFVTALVVLALRASGTSPADAVLRRGEAWLTAHQQSDGSWPASSMNKLRDPESDAAPFMSDAATGYAALALAPTADTR